MSSPFIDWRDRLSEAAYVSPIGLRFEFLYENVSEEFEKKTTAFEFSESNETHVQDLGHTGRRFPMRIIFSGTRFDVIASDFSECLAERGVGSLEHPMYGTFNVVPFGLIRRRDDLKTAANQTIFDVTFWETTLVLFPAAGVDPADAVDEAVEESIQTNSEDFEEEIELETEVEAVTLADRVTSLIGKIRARLEPLANVVTVIAGVAAEIAAAFQAVFDSINSAIDTLIRDPLSLAFQMQEMATLPARSFASISGKLGGYKNLLDDVISGPAFFPSSGNNSLNLFKSDELVAVSALLGAVSSLTGSTFVTRTDALGAADTLLGMLDDLTVWRDGAYRDLGAVDTGEIWQQLTRAVFTGAGFLVEISFTLKQERSVFLDRARTPLDLTAELYGELDSQLDFLIASNRLEGFEMFEIPKGREIVYYR